MLRGERKYYAIIIFVALVLFAIQQTQREPTNYDHTYSHIDKNPYGGFVLRDLLPGFIGIDEVDHINLTLYEIQDRLGPEVNLIIFADQVFFDEQETKVLLEAVSEGMTAFIAVDALGGVFTDSLGIFQDYNIYNNVVNNNQDSLMITQSDLRKAFQFKGDAARQYFSSINGLEYEVKATDDNENIYAFEADYGKGRFIINSMPLAFTNNYLFYKENADFAASLLKGLPAKPTIWSEYYQLGRIETRTPLRVVLTSPSLKLAYVMSCIALVMFMFFEAKRKQRIIPIIMPLSNTTLTFVRTIGNLYLKGADHKDIALKRIQYFHEFVRNNYYLNFEQFKPDFFERLASKSGKSIDEVKSLYEFMERAKNSPSVDTATLKKLNQLIESFYGRRNK